MSPSHARPGTHTVKSINNKSFSFVQKACFVQFDPWKTKKKKKSSQVLSIKRQSHSIRHLLQCERQYSENSWKRVNITEALRPADESHYLQLESV